MYPILVLTVLVATTKAAALPQTWDDSLSISVASATSLPASLSVFDLVGRSGVPAMHAALLQDGTVVFLDKIETYTDLKLDNGRYAFSSIYSPDSQDLTPLKVRSNPFCSAGAFLADGRLISVGGNSDLKWLDPTVDDGLAALRYLDLQSIDDGWTEPGNKLASNRWYATTQVLADGSVFVASGSLNALDVNNKSNNNPTYEILNAEGISDGTNIVMDILERNQPYWMYPFLHLLTDGTLFTFVSKSSEILDVTSGETIKTMPDLDGLYRTYPNTGSSIMLPLTSSNDYMPTIMICGGGGWQDLDSPGDASCGSIEPMSDTPQWTYTSMPEGRCMVEGVLLLDGTVLWVNGAQKGAQGFGLADEPALEALIYDPSDASWASAGKSDIPRLYHSVALMLLDGTVLIAGSNPNEMPILEEYVDEYNQSKKYPTEFRVERWTPPYLVGRTEEDRPYDIRISETVLKADGMTFGVRFKSTSAVNKTQVVLYHGGFVTHSLHMGQVMIMLDHESSVDEEGEFHEVLVDMPDIALAPGPYVVYVVVNGLPGIGQFISLSN